MQTNLLGKVARLYILFGLFIVHYVIGIIITGFISDFYTRV